MLGQYRKVFSEGSGEELGGSPERNQEPIKLAPIPPYPLPLPARSSPGDEPNVHKMRTVPEQPTNVLPPARQPKPFIQRAPAPVHEPMLISHPGTVTLPPTQEQPRPSKTLTSEPSKILTPVNRKELTPAQTSEPEKINEKLTNPPQNDKKTLIFSPAPTAKKLQKKMQFKGKKGRQRTEAEVRDLLTFVQNRNGAWPSDNYVSDQMRRYYRREYPEYFRKARKGKKIQSTGSAPIDLQSRRTGTGV